MFLGNALAVGRSGRIRAEGERSDLTTWPTDANWLWSPSEPFTDASVGRRLVITGGTGWVPDEYLIRYVNNNYATGTPDGNQNMAYLYSSPTPGVGITGGEGYIKPRGINVVAEGDSLTMGFSTPWDAYTIQLSQLLPEITVKNIAAPGARILDMIAEAATADALLFPGETNLFLFYAGTNDLFYGATAAETISRYSSYAAARKAAGWTVIGFTLTPRSDPGTPGTFTADAATVNTAIRAMLGTEIDALVDLALDPSIGQSGDELNATYYVDLVHHTTAGGAIIADLTKDAIESLLEETPPDPEFDPTTVMDYVFEASYGVAKAGPSLGAYTVTAVTGSAVTTSGATLASLTSGDWVIIQGKACEVASAAVNTITLVHEYPGVWNGAGDTSFTNWIPCDEGDACEVWVARGTGGLYASQATLAQRPIWYETGGGGEPYPILEFDGADDSLTLPSFSLPDEFTAISAGERASGAKWLPVNVGATGTLTIYSDNNAYFVNAAGGAAGATYTGGTGRMMAEWTRTPADACNFRATGQALTLITSDGGAFAFSNIGARGGDRTAGGFSIVMVAASEPSSGDMADLEEYIFNLAGFSM